jgi:surface antigen
MVTAESAFGHVAIVRGVSGGNVTISEMNYVGPFIVSQRTIPANFWAIRGYIYG